MDGLRLESQKLQKSEFSKLIISIFQHFFCQNGNQWHKMSGKNCHIYFFYFGSKINELEQKKIGKKRKYSNNQNVAGNI